MTIIRKVDTDGSGPVRVVSFALFVGTVTTLLSSIGATALWAVAQKWERYEMAKEVRAEIREYVEDKFDAFGGKADEIHGNMAERIRENAVEIGVVRGRLESHIEAVRDGAREGRSGR